MNHTPSTPPVEKASKEKTVTKERKSFKFQEGTLQKWSNVIHYKATSSEDFFLLPRAQGGSQEQAAGWKDCRS